MAWHAILEGIDEELVEENANGREHDRDERGRGQRNVQHVQRVALVRQDDNERQERPRRNVLRGGEGGGQIHWPTVAHRGTLTGALTVRMVWYGYYGHTSPAAAERAAAPVTDMVRRSSVMIRARTGNAVIENATAMKNPNSPNENS
jgi:hypothetical protein